MESEFWHQRWQDGQIGFHRDDVNDGLERFWDHIECPKEATVLVPLCGKSLDLRWLHSQGYGVVGVELSPLAIQQFWESDDHQPTRDTVGKFERTQRAGLSLLCGDIFDGTADDFDNPCAFYDRASIIALRPDLRLRYCQKLAEVMPHGSVGLMLTLSYDQSKFDGPPFSVDPTLLGSLLGDVFEIECLSSEEMTIESPRMLEAQISSLKRHVFRLKRL